MVFVVVVEAKRHRVDIVNEIEIIPILFRTYCRNVQNEIAAVTVVFCNDKVICRTDTIIKHN